MADFWQIFWFIWKKGSNWLNLRLKWVLNSFLAVAEELKVKWLAQNQSNGKQKSSSSAPPAKSASLRLPDHQPSTRKPFSFVVIITEETVWNRPGTFDAGKYPKFQMMIVKNLIFLFWKKGIRINRDPCMCHLGEYIAPCSRCQIKIAGNWTSLDHSYNVNFSLDF